jgi:hypothetical protein
MFEEIGAQRLIVIPSGNPLILKDSGTAAFAVLTN